MANKTIRTPEKDKTFFAAVADGEPIGVAAEMAGYTRSRIYVWRDEDAEFGSQFEEANERAIERMEREADRRAIEGVEKPVHYQGERVDLIREYSDTLLIFRLKAKRPSVYRDNQHVQLEGNVRAGVVQDKPQTPEEWARQHDQSPPRVNGHANGNGSTNGHT